MSAEAGTLDEAWATAEAALPEGWTVGGVRLAVVRGDEQTWEAHAAWDDDFTEPPDPMDVQADGPTPAAALLALAAALRGVPA